MLARLYAYRHFIFASIRADLKGRFARSSLGAMWFVLNPLAQALIFAIVLSEVMGAKLAGVDRDAAYPIYLLAGIAAWNFFAEIVTRSMTIFIEQASAMKKIVFPKICLPAIVFGTALVNHLLLIAATLVVFLFIGHYPGPAIASIVFGILAISLFGFGLGLICGVFNVFVRDVSQIVAVVLQLWFWLTPVVYPITIVPERFSGLVAANPMTEMVAVYQDAMLYGRWPDPAALVLPFAAGLLLSAIALFVFRRASSELVDAL